MQLPMTQSSQSLLLYLLHCMCNCCCHLPDYVSVPTAFVRHLVQWKRHVLRVSLRFIPDNAAYWL